MPTSYTLQGWDIRNKRVVDICIYKTFEPKSFEIAEELYWKQLGMSKVNKILKNADLSNIDFDGLNEDFKLNSNLQKALGDKADQFIKFIKKLNIEHKAYDKDIHPLGLYVETRDKGTHQENVHNFWLKNFGLDTAKKGIGSAIASALNDMSYELKDSQEYKDTLDDNDTNKLPKDEQFKINLFYEWDAIKKNTFGDYSDNDRRRKMSFRQFLQDKLYNGDYEDDYEKQLIKDAIEEVKNRFFYESMNEGIFKKQMGWNEISAEEARELISKTNYRRPPGKLLGLRYYIKRSPVDQNLYIYAYDIFSRSPRYTYKFEEGHPGFEDVKAVYDKLKGMEKINNAIGDLDETAATQGADMGSFNTFTKKLTLDEDGSRRVAVVGAGRLNPPTIGHEKLINAMVSYAHGEKPILFLTHSQDNKKNPLSYQSKIKWARKAFGNKVDIPETNAKTILQFLQELYQDGYTDIIYVGGGDRIGGAEDVTQTILKYNGQPDKQGNIIYNFNSIDFKNAGERSGNDLASNASASLARKYVLENEFDHFKEIVPFNEKDSYGLFKELKYAMTGKEESFLEACEKRIKSLREASTTLNTPLGNVLKKYIGNDVEYKSLNQGRHPKETLRINSQKSKEELINDLKRKLSSVPNDPITLNGVEYHISKINFNDIGPHDGASHEYDSIPVEVESDNDKQVFYISLATKDDKFASSKLYTPNKVLGNGIGHFVKNSSLEFNEGYEFLEKIYKEAIGNAKGDLKGFESHVSSVEGVNETNINSVMKDFGEVLSAGCLAHVLGSPEEVYFPAASNEPLVDFIVNGTIKVSQKAGSGAAPSGDSIFGLISDSKLNANQILVDYSKNDIKRIMAMISFFRNYVFDSSVSIHNGYVNMAEAVMSGKINFVDLPNLSSIQKYFKPNSVTGKNMERFIDDMKPLIGSNIKYDPQKISNQDYCETIRNRYIARILIVAVNKDEVLIKGMNTLLSACLGEFVQVYLINPTEFLKGHFIFKVKQIDSSHEYVLSDASAIDAKNRIGTKKLSMKLK